jgi:hypothetical protein
MLAEQLLANFMEMGRALVVPRPSDTIRNRKWIMFSSKSHPKLLQGFRRVKTKRLSYDAARRWSAFPANSVKFHEHLKSNRFRGFCLGWIPRRNDDESWLNVLHRHRISSRFATVLWALLEWSGKKKKEKIPEWWLRGIVWWGFDRSSTTENSGGSMSEKNQKDQSFKAAITSSSLSEVSNSTSIISPTSSPITLWWNRQL